MSTRTSTLKGVHEARSESDNPKSGIRLLSPPTVPRPNSAKPNSAKPKPLSPSQLSPSPLSPNPLKPSELSLRAPRQVTPAPNHLKLVRDELPTLLDLPVADETEVGLPFEDDWLDIAEDRIIPEPSPSRRAAVRPRSPRIRGAVALPTQSVPPSRPGILEIPHATPSPIQVRSLVSTAQDWPLVRPPARPAVPEAPVFGLPIRSSMHSLPAFLPPAELLGLAPTSELSFVLELPARQSESDLRMLTHRPRWPVLLAVAMVVATVALVLLAY